MRAHELLEALKPSQYRHLVKRRSIKIFTLAIGNNMIKSIKEKLKSITAMDVFIVVSIIMLVVLVVGITLKEPSSALVLK